MRWGWAVIGLLFLATAAPGQAPEPSEASAKAALAWRLDQLSSSLLGPRQPDAAWRRTGALLGAAGRLDPAEPRFPHLRSMALMHVGDTDGAIDALIAYRRIMARDHVPDPAAQVQLIDLYASRLQTLDAKIDYLQSLLGRDNIAVEVRSQLAVEAAVLLNQKSRQLASDMIRRAVDLYPLPEATRLYYEWVASQQPLKPRVAALLAVLRSNPNQWAYMRELARLLAANGLVEQSLPWYDLSVRIVLASGPARPPEFHDLLLDYGSELIIAGRPDRADTLLGQMLDGDPLDAHAWFLKVTVTKSSGDQNLYTQALDLARSALIKRWNLLHEEILSGAPASRPAPGGVEQPPASEPVASQPAVEPLDPAPVLQKLAHQGNPQDQNALVIAVSDLAWFELYYDNRPPEARKWIDVLRGVLPADSPLLARLEGWYALATGNPPQARQMLAKIADHDPLAALGLLRVQQAEQKPLQSHQVRNLLDEYRTGLLAAIVWDALHGEKTEPESQPVAPTTQPATEPANEPSSQPTGATATADAETQPATQPATQASSQPSTAPMTQFTVAEIEEELKQFPTPLLAVLDPHTARRIYALHFEPLQHNVAFGMPALARVSITNNSEYDLTIGGGALIRPEMWFNAQIVGLGQRSFPGTAFDQIANEMVLRPGASLEQVVRLDEMTLRQALEQTPGVANRISADVVLNPVILPAEAGQGAQTAGPVAMIGPAGLSAGLVRSFVYEGLPLGTQGKGPIDAALSSESPVDRLSGLDVLAAYVRLARRPDADQTLRRLTADFPQKIARLRGDRSAAVASWASYLLATLSPPPQQEQIVAQMSRSSEASARLLSLMAGVSLPEARQKQLASSLSGDGDADVKAAAAATITLLEQPATQPAATQASPATPSR